MRIVSSVALAIVAGIGFGGSAKAINSESLLPGCQQLVSSFSSDGENISFTHNEDTLRCWNYFAALQDVAVIQWNGEATPALHACLPPESRRSELIRAYVEYAEQHPDQGQDTGSLVFVNMVEGRWPCPAQ